MTRYIWYPGTGIYPGSDLFPASGPVAGDGDGKVAVRVPFASVRRGVAFRGAAPSNVVFASVRRGVALRGAVPSKVGFAGATPRRVAL